MWPTIHLETTTSTMDEARSRAHDGASEGTTIVADMQTQGRGRRGRHWHSPAGAGLWCTTILRPLNVIPAEAGTQEGVRGHLDSRFRGNDGGTRGNDGVNGDDGGTRGNDGAATETLALVAGLAVVDAVMSFSPRQTPPLGLKWPNDVEVAGKKLAGVLLESDGTDFVLVGVGINLLPACELGLPQALQERVIGMHEVLSSSVSRDDVLHAFLTALQTRYQVWKLGYTDVLLKEWARYDVLKNQRVWAEGLGGSMKGVARGLHASGALRVTTESGQETLIRWGEVVVRMAESDEHAKVKTDVS